MNDRPTTLPRFTMFASAAFLVLMGCQILRAVLMMTELPVQVFVTPVLEFNLVYSENRGVNFGLYGNAGANQAVLAGIAGLVCAVMAIVLLRKQRLTAAVAGGFIVGGGLSNIYERLSFGYVFDYLNTPFLGLGNPFSYNVADIFIVLPIVWWVFKS